jgi:hypothetical protein
MCGLLFMQISITLCDETGRKENALNIPKLAPQKTTGRMRVTLTRIGSNRFIFTHLKKSEAQEGSIDRW